MKKSLILATVLFLAAACASKSKPETKAEAKPVEVKKEAQVTMSEEYKRSLKNVSLSCSRSNDVRKVEIEAQTPKGCDLYYSVSGNRNKVAWSTNGESHCSDVKQRIQTNLEQAGFKCEIPTRASASDAVSGKK